MNRSRGEGGTRMVRGRGRGDAAAAAWIFRGGATTRHDAALGRREDDAIVRAPQEASATGFAGTTSTRRGDASAGTWISPRTSRGDAADASRIVRGPPGRVLETTRIRRRRYRDGVSEPGPLRALSWKGGGGRAANVKPANLRLARGAVSAAAAPDVRSALSARAGERPAEKRPGFFVFAPGLRHGAADLTNHPALRCDPAALGRWDAPDGGVAEEVVATRLKMLKRERKLAPDAWDPLRGPGWPGVYSDRSARGLRDVDPRDVAARDSLAEALRLWGDIQAADPAQPYTFPLRCRVASATSGADLFDAVAWLAAVAPDARRAAGLGVLAADVVGDEGVVVLSCQGAAAAAAAARALSAATANFCFALDGRRLDLRVGDVDTPPPRDRPRRRAWRAFFRSPCGRFTYTGWWGDGAARRGVLCHVATGPPVDRPRRAGRRRRRRRRARVCRRGRLGGGGARRARVGARGRGRGRRAEESRGGEGRARCVHAGAEIHTSPKPVWTYAGIIVLSPRPDRAARTRVISNVSQARRGGEARRAQGQGRG